MLVNIPGNKIFHKVCGNNIFGRRSYIQKKEKFNKNS